MKKKKIEYSNWTKDDLITEIKRIRETTYGLVWHRDVPQEKLDVLINPDAKTPQELFSNELQGKPFPVLREIKKSEVESSPNDVTNILIEGDNYHSLAVLNFTHEESIDLIYIDPPYNTGKNDFKYNDKFDSGYVEKEDPFRHSKWLAFMEKRLKLAHKLLSPTGAIVIHIDENEENALYFLLVEIFGENNDLGKIIWNKKNPKGDSKGVSIMHESILCFAKNRENFLKLENVLQSKKSNAESILKKARKLYKKMGKTEIPEDVKSVIKPFGYKKQQLDSFKVHYDLESINKEFQNWISKQDFSGGEKAYRYIDEKGDVFQPVSMAWPNKKKAPADYFRPLIHPVTKKECPLPPRGWRYPSTTMKKLLKADKIVFGDDHTTQPRQKYFLTENLFQNTPSIFSYGASDDELFEELGIRFDYPKPVEVAKYLLSSIHPNPKIILDFMAGSGTTGHAVLELNREDEKARQFILCTNDENGIASDICQPRIKKAIEGYKKRNGEKVEGLGGNLKYFTAYDFVESEPTDKNKRKLVKKSTEMLCIKEGVYDLVSETEDYKILKNPQDKYLGIIFYEDAINDYKKVIKKLKCKVVTYVFSLGDDPHRKEFEDVKNQVDLQPIPEVILRVYREIFK